MALGDKRNVEIELVTKMLGTAPSRKIYDEWLADRAPTTEAIEEELETSPEENEDDKKGHTKFHSDENGLFIYGYMVKGFIKSAIEALQEAGVINKIPAYKKWVDKMVFITPRRIYLGTKEAHGILQRPLRTQTPKGERVAVCASDYINEGTKLAFDVELIPNNKGLTWPVLKKCLEYGEYVGLGQWRGSGGYGTFKLLSINPEVKGEPKPKAKTEGKSK